MKDTKIKQENKKKNGIRAEAIMDDFVARANKQVIRQQQEYDRIFNGVTARKQPSMMSIRVSRALTPQYPSLSRFLAKLGKEIEPTGEVVEFSKGTMQRYTDGSLRWQ